MSAPETNESIVDIIEAGIFGYSLIVRKAMTPAQKLAYVVERSYLYVSEDDEEVWKNERQTYNSWTDLIEAQGAHLFSLPPQNIHHRFKRLIFETLDAPMRGARVLAVHPAWREHIGTCKEMLQPEPAGD